MMMKALLMMRLIIASVFFDHAGIIVPETEMVKVEDEPAIIVEKMEKTEEQLVFFPKQEDENPLLTYMKNHEERQLQAVVKQIRPQKTKEKGKV